MNEIEHANAVQRATLYVVATPIGNLSDTSPRMRAVLAQVDAIAAEDTRHTAQLLSLLGLKKPLLACHHYNETEAATRIIAQLAAGDALALVSDAGTPAVSDPGALVVRRVAEAGFTVVPVPGPSSVLAAVAASGLVDGPFYFAGFMPAKGQPRQQALKALGARTEAVVLFEAPHRIVELFDGLVAAGAHARACCVGREMTKRFEHFYRGTVAQVLAFLRGDSHGERGEFAIVLGAQAGTTENTADPRVNTETLLALLLPYLPLKTAVQLVVQINGAAKNQVYDLALQMQRPAPP
ncbi:MAG: 16S rRNA (cytidine(1402)-2'-O)-methyltransferase [Burkholderiaceae bacterium]